MSEDHLFYSASDADSEGEEGTYFIYTYEECFEALTKAGYENVHAILRELGVSHHGNFEGKNIIRLEEGKMPQDFAGVKQVLANLRKNREYPFIDKKIQTSWSAMMIESLFFLGAIDAKYTQKATDALDALLATMYKEGTLYHTTLIHKEPKIKAFLEDYAFLTSALLAGYNATGEEIYLIRAQGFANKALEDFYDKGDWRFSIGEFETKAETSDSTYTSSVGITVGNLLTLGTLLEDEKYTRFAFKTLEYNSYELGRRPIYYPYLLKQMLRYLKGDRTVKATDAELRTNAHTIASLSYPFVWCKRSDESGFMVCGEKICFGFSEDPSMLEYLIQTSF